MPSIRTRRRRASKFKRHVKAHKTVIRNETWFGDAPPDLGPQFTAKKTAERAQTLVKILVRAAKREKRAPQESSPRLHGSRKEAQSLSPKSAVWLSCLPAMREGIPKSQGRRARERHHEHHKGQAQKTPHVCDGGAQENDVYARSILAHRHSKSESLAERRPYARRDQADNNRQCRPRSGNPSWRKIYPVALAPRDVDRQASQA